MADAFEDQLADAIVAELNDSARGWDTFFNTETTVAVRTRAPWYTAAQLATLKCAVVPLTIERTRASRALRQFNYGFAVDLQRTVTPTDDTTLKALSRAAEQIHDWFDDAHALTGLTGWTCFEAERADVYNAELMYAEKLWETMIVVTVRGFRA